MSFRHLLLGLIANVVVSGGAEAQRTYVQNYAGWQGLSSLGREGYVMGIIDFGQVFYVEGAAAQARQWGVDACLRRVSPVSTSVADAVTDTYRANPEIWGLSPTAVLNYVIIRMCANDINLFMQAQNLPPLDAARVLANMKAAPTQR